MSTITVFITKGGVYNIGWTNVEVARFTAQRFARNAADAAYQLMGIHNGPWYIEWVDKRQLYVTTEDATGFERIFTGNRQEVYHALVAHLHMMRGSIDGS